VPRATLLLSRQHPLLHDAHSASKTLLPLVVSHFFSQLDRVLEAARATAAGYVRHNPLPPAELRLAWAGAKLRALVSVTMSGATQEKHPDDAYIGETEKPGWALLDYIVDMPEL
jgi:hypothetical protein